MLPPAPKYHANQRVFHAKFGEGTVLEVSERSGDQEVAVSFLRHGPKRLLASLAGMEIIEEQFDPAGASGAGAN